uniref:DNAX-activation protein 10 n=1 Tax=Podarcis muralis TaxID=64176 RepID=A0A670K7E8_PODMU
SWRDPREILALADLDKTGGDSRPTPVRSFSRARLFQNTPIHFAVCSEGQNKSLPPPCMCRSIYRLEGSSIFHGLTLLLSWAACDDCVDLSIGLVAGIVVADLLITLGIMFLVYYCSSKKPTTSLGGGAAGGGARGRTRGEYSCGTPGLSTGVPSASSVVPQRKLEVI